MLGPGSRRQRYNIRVRLREWSGREKRKGEIVHFVVSKQRRRSEKVLMRMRWTGWARERGGRRTVPPPPRTLGLGALPTANCTEPTTTSSISCRSTCPEAHAILPDAQPLPPQHPPPQHKGAGACASDSASELSQCLSVELPVEPHLVVVAHFRPRLVSTSNLEPRTSNTKTPSRFCCQLFVLSPHQFQSRLFLGPDSA